MKAGDYYVTGSDEHNIGLQLLYFHMKHNKLKKHITSFTD